MELYKVDGVALPTPQENIQYQESDLQASGIRDGNGLLHKVTVRWGVRSITLTWPKLTNAEMQLIRNITKKEYFVFTYYSDINGRNGTINECYRGADWKYVLSHVSNDEGYWTDISLSFIER